MMDIPTLLSSATLAAMRDELPRALGVTGQLADSIRRSTEPVKLTSKFALTSQFGEAIKAIHAGSPATLLPNAAKMTHSDHAFEASSKLLRGLNEPPLFKDRMGLSKALGPIKDGAYTKAVLGSALEKATVRMPKPSLVEAIESFRSVTDLGRAVQAWRSPLVEAIQAAQHTIQAAQHMSALELRSVVDLSHAVARVDARAGVLSPPSEESEDLAVGWVEPSAEVPHVGLMTAVEPAEDSTLVSVAAIQIECASCSTPLPIARRLMHLVGSVVGLLVVRAIPLCLKCKHEVKHYPDAFKDIIDHYGDDCGLSFEEVFGEHRDRTQVPLGASGEGPRRGHLRLVWSRKENE